MPFARERQQLADTIANHGSRPIESTSVLPDTLAGILGHIATEGHPEARVVAGFLRLYLASGQATDLSRGAARVIRHAYKQQRVDWALLERIVSRLSVMDGWWLLASAGLDAMRAEAAAQPAAAEP